MTDNEYRQKTSRELKALETKVDSYEKGIKQLTKITDDLIKRYTKLAYDFNKLKSKHSSLSATVSNVNSKITQLEHKKSR